MQSSNDPKSPAGENVFSRTLTHTMSNISHGAGEPLPPEVMTRLQPMVGAHDLSNIRVHTNNQNVQNIGAKAFSQGTDIHFAPGKYDPNSSKGLELLAHEATHIVQQGNLKGAGSKKP